LDIVVNPSNRVYKNDDEIDFNTEDI
jgi:hypothetical protein